LRYQQTLRVERAEHLISHGATVEAAAHEVGFDDARMLRRLRARAEAPAEGNGGTDGGGAAVGAVAELGAAAGRL
jgi:hypothetical protein